MSIKKKRQRKDSPTPNEVCDYNIDSISIYDLEGSLESSQKMLAETKEELEGKGYYNLHLSLDEFDPDCTELSVSGLRLETAGEVKVRLRNYKNKKRAELDRVKQLEKEELALYKKLKKKYGE